MKSWTITNDIIVDLAYDLFGLVVVVAPVYLVDHGLSMEFVIGFMVLVIGSE